MTKRKKLAVALLVSGFAAGTIALMPLAKVLFRSEEQGQNVIAKEAHLNWRDGLYVGTAVNQRGEANRIEVMIEKGQIHHIRAIDSEDASLVFTKVFRQMAKEMVARNSYDVDAVSGATVSSQGIIAAVKDAVFKAQGQ